MLMLEQVMSRSAGRIACLHPVVAQAATRLVERAYARGVYIIIVQGLRTFAEQAEIYEQGRTKPGPIVSNAAPGLSFHNYGVAIDFALLMPDGRSVSWDTVCDGDGDHMADWMEVVEEAKRLGFFWGGDFRGTFKDQPHLEMAFGLTIRQWLGGSRPSQAAIAAILEKINGEDDEEMTAAEKEAFKALQDKVAALEARSAADPILPAVPDWAQGAVKRAIAKHAFTDPKGTHDFYRLVVILDNLGYFK